MHYSQLSRVQHLCFFILWHSPFHKWNKVSVKVPLEGTGQLAGKERIRFHKLELLKASQCLSIRQSQKPSLLGAWEHHTEGTWGSETNPSSTETGVLLKFQTIFTIDSGNNTTAWEGTGLVSMAGSGRMVVTVIMLLFNLASTQLIFQRWHLHREHVFSWLISPIAFRFTHKWLKNLL